MVLSASFHLVEFKMVVGLATTESAPAIAAGSQGLKFDGAGCDVFLRCGTRSNHGIVSLGSLIPLLP